MTPGVLEGPDGKKTIRCGTPQAAGGGGTFPNEPSDHSLIDHHKGQAVDGGGSWIKQNVHNTAVASGTTPSGDGSFLRFTYPDGEGGGGNNGRYIRQEVSNYTEVYAAYRIRPSADFHGHQSGVNKIGFITYTDQASGVVTELGGSDSGELSWKIVTQGCATATEHTDGKAYNEVSSPASDNIPRGSWGLWECLAVMNTPGSSDGGLHGWIDGNKVYQNTSFQHNDGQCGTYAFDQLKIEWIWGGTGDTVPSTFHVDMDEARFTGIAGTN